MSKELTHVENLWRGRILRAVFFISLLLAITTYLYQLVGSVQLFTLPRGSVELSMPYTKYLAGESISITVTNNFSTPINISNDCPYEPLAVYAYKDKTWKRIHSKSKTRECKEEDNTVLIRPGTSVTTNFDAWPDLFKNPGKYRIALQVQYYEYIPYRDFEVVKKPTVKTAKSSSGSKTTVVRRVTTQNQATSGSTSSNNDDEDDEGEAPAAPSNPQTYVMYVTSSGNYNVTSIRLDRGDTLTIIYSQPRSGEVRTRFTSLNGSPAVASLTVDNEFTSRSRVFSSAGSWRYKADDHSGNSGTIVVE
ncbi:MAG TPA: hypothetical protein PLU21_03755 [Candidatus Saccharibacteria bacterium]|nr:hypothetical protein [Candidatus Saccharibacteria bacterium]